MVREAAAINKSPATPPFPQLFEPSLLPLLLEIRPSIRTREVILNGRRHALAGRSARSAS